MNLETHPYKATWSMPSHDRLGSNASQIELFATEAEAKAAIVAPFKHGFKHAKVEFLDKTLGLRGQWVRCWKRENGKLVKRWK